MKYRQRGYREGPSHNDRKENQHTERPPDLGNREQTRSLRHAIDRETIVVTRCGKCGNQIPSREVVISYSTKCIKCGTSLHSCRHCKHFDPDERFQCREKIEERIPNKWSANGCNVFKPVQSLDATGRRADTTEDARSKFHNLFKNL